MSRYANIGKVITLINEKYPNVSRIDLQPVVGVEAGQYPEVRATQNHLDIAAAVEKLVAQSGDSILAAGNIPTVLDCSHYSDNLGHLSLPGAQHQHEKLQVFYVE